MKGFEQSGENLNSYNVEDYSDAPFYQLLRKLPEPLAKRHIARIETEEMTDEEATSYLEDLLERRREAVAETVISDPEVAEYIKGQEEEVFHAIETWVFTDPECHIGAGQTARIKRYDLKIGDKTLTVAIKYLTNPTKETNTARKEHDIIVEVERMKRIEEMERDVNTPHIKVPHPYLHHRTDKVQCYGMELIEGFDLERELDTVNPDLVLQIQAALASLDEKELLQEIDAFCRRMHDYCIHGDIKLKNIMVNTDGTFYLIDFGQSKLVNDFTEKDLDRLEQIKDDEISGLKVLIRKFLDQVRRYDPEKQIAA